MENKEEIYSLIDDVEGTVAKKMMQAAEKFFGTHSDPDQIPVGWESRKKLLELSSNALLFKLDEQGNPVSWIVVVPTSQELMNKFMVGEITERQLFDMTIPMTHYEALYLCSAITVPQYQHQGLATQLLVAAISRIPMTQENTLFAWPISSEGNRFVDKLETVLGRKILRK